MRISDWSSDVCSSDLSIARRLTREDRFHRGRVGGVIDAVAAPLERARQRAREIHIVLDDQQMAFIGHRQSPSGETRFRRSAGRSAPPPRDRTSVVTGKSVSGSVALGGRRIIKKTKKQTSANPS